MPEPRLPPAIESKLTERERAQFEDVKNAARRADAEILHRIQLAFPHTTLLECPISPDNRVEVRVTQWPSSVNEFDVLIKALAGVRSAFLASRRPRRKP
jgi:hypothetical protein